MKKAIELLDRAWHSLEIPQSRADKYSRGYISEAMTLINEAIDSLQASRWETPEQYEKRTGKKYPDKGPVWFRHTCKNYRRERDFIAWGLQLYKDARDEYDFHPPNYKQIVIATEAGPPPDNWSPEEVGK
jgi:hypothetical protein